MSQAGWYKSTLDRALDLLETLVTWDYYETEHIDATDKATKLLASLGRTRKGTGL